MTEAARAGVPTLGIPLLGDQKYNAAVMNHKKVGVYIDILEVEKENVLTNTLTQVLNNPIYKNNAKILQKKLHLDPFKPKEKLVRWVEFAAEFSDVNELNLPTIDELGWMVYYSLDVVFVCSAIVLLCAYILFAVLRFLVSLFSAPKKLKTF